MPIVFQHLEYDVTIFTSRNVDILPGIPVYFFALVMPVKNTYFLKRNPK